MAAFAHILVPAQRVLSFPWRLIGFVPLAIGILLNLLAHQALKKHETTVKPFAESKALITHGVFGFSRNPMYLGMVLILLGIALLLGSATPFLVVLLLAAILDYAFIGPEERKLEDKFGERFRDYTSKVRRWV